MFKKIYIEITNKCNLNCDFCSKSKRELQEINVEDFETIIKKIDKYTDFLYLHVKGEPLCHSDFGSILCVCRKYKKKVNITTNGTLLRNKMDIILKNRDVIRQVNVSLHSLCDSDVYLNMVSEAVLDILKNSSIVVSLRLWNIKNKVDKNERVYEFLVDKFSLPIDLLIRMKEDNSIKLRNNLYLNKDRVFVWPSLDNDYYSETGKCYGTITHVGILSDGTVVPCCLDGDGVIKLGNIYEDDFGDIIKSKLFVGIYNGFLNKKKICDLCKKCSFLDK